MGHHENADFGHHHEALPIGTTRDHGSAAATDPAELGGEDPIGAQIKDLIDTRIRPAATQDGGDVTFRGFKDGVVYLEFHGSASSLMNGIENMLRHYVPEVEAVKDHRDALPKPGLETPEGKAIQDFLEEQVNPAVAAHGGHIPWSMSRAIRSISGSKGDARDVAWRT